MGANAVSHHPSDSFRVYSCFLFLLQHLLKIDLSFVFFSSTKYLNYFNVLLHFYCLYRAGAFHSFRTHACYYSVGRHLLAVSTAPSFPSEPANSCRKFTFHIRMSITPSHTLTHTSLFNEWLVYFFCFYYYTLHIQITIVVLTIGQPSVRGAGILQHLVAVASPAHLSSLWWCDRA